MGDFSPSIVSKNWFEFTSSRNIAILGTSQRTNSRFFGSTLSNKHLGVPVHLSVDGLHPAQDDLQGLGREAVKLGRQLQQLVSLHLLLTALVQEASLNAEEQTLAPLRDHGHLHPGGGTRHGDKVVPHTHTQHHGRLVKYLWNFDRSCCAAASLIIIRILYLYSTVHTQIAVQDALHKIK